MRVLAIDPGLRNLAYCVTHRGDVVELKKVDLFGGAPIRTNAVFDATLAWATANAPLFEAADVVLIERQFVNRLAGLSMGLMVVQTVLQTLHHAKTVLVCAMSVKKRFGTAKGNYRGNKLAAVEKAREIAPEAVAARYFDTAGKRDDLADCYLLARYWDGAS